MPSSDNKRIFYPAHQIGIKPDSDGDYTFAAGDEVRGVQSASMATNFNLTPIFQLGSLPLYENREEIPDIEVSISKVGDGYAPIFCMATQDGVDPTLVGRSTARAMVGMSIFPDTSVSTSGNSPLTAVAASGMFVNSVSYNFTTEGPFSEDVSLVGNNKLWYKTSLSGDGGRPDYGEADLRTMPAVVFAGAFTDDEAPLAVGGIAHSEDLIYAPVGTGVDSNGAIDESDVTVLPVEVYGISQNGINEVGPDGSFNAHISSITVSVDLSREDINELGRKGPYHRAVAFPVEVTTSIEATATEGDLVSALEIGNFGSGVGCDNVGRNLNDRTIRIATCDGLRIYLGRKNKLQETNYSGGDSEGGNVTVSYNYVTYNDFTVMHPEDPAATGEFAWANRDDYLTEAGS